ncbi:RDD family protein [Hymenobacter taeanensis]|uniref:RDD family protein n=1 Tax=Hymenobacter taeanensis TaxID=2735321 RepID=A0A6M6BC45_9BACT|nr:MULTISPECIES: RDD family protein [Hymenobacter]QJX45737.1 RDD family protein [Hymenobacter taeanensis]UOQ79577.1 RDD family protein [Hymenobacter sp. 5414T-23]
MSTIRIQTAQNVVVEYDTASVGDRIVAQLIDWLVMGLWTLGVGFLLDKALSYGTLKSSLFYVLVLAPTLVYHPVCEVFFNGQSLGKQVRRIKVTRLDGTRPSLGDYLLRWLIGLFEIQITAGTVALLAALINGRGQRLGDLVAGTTVVSLRQPQHNDFELTLVPPGYQIIFPQVAVLTDHDMALIRRLYQQAVARHNYTLLNDVANKVKTLTGIQTALHDEPFLRTILRDHAAFLQEETAR